MIIHNPAQGQTSEAYLRQAFSWLARIGACPKFGSRPIGWYQMHACAALRHWQPVVSARELYDIADKVARS